MSVGNITLFGSRALGEPIGRCIYCGSDGGPTGLSNEHIVAFSLASDAYLARASCESCAKKTSYLEGYAGRHVFGSMRRHFDIQSRRKKIELGSATVICQTEDGEETRHIARELLPATVLLPLWESPGLLREGVCVGLDQCGIWRWREDNADEKMNLLKRKGDLNCRIVSIFRPVVFARMLAKIAHAMTIALLGADSFKPYLPRLILGDEENAALLIGGAAPPTDPLPPIPRGTKIHHHTIGLTIMGAAHKPDIVVATVRLFQHIGSPTYSVVVGEALASADLRLQMQIDGMEPQRS